MSRVLGSMSALALAVVALFVIGGAAAHVVPLTSYNVVFVEHGLPAGSTWSVYFNGVTYTSGTGKSMITISGVAAGGYYYSAYTVSAGTGIQYAPGPATGDIYPPNELTQYIVYNKQYQITFAESPAAGGSTTPSGTAYYNAGENFPISAIDAQGYKFVSWATTSKADTFGNNTYQSTNLTVKATATITAKFKATKYAITYTEVGLPASTTWSVVSGGTAYYSSTSTLTAGTAIASTLSWSTSPVSVGTGVQYAPDATSGSMSVPDQTMESFSFVKQYQVTFAASPSGTGSTLPSGAAYYNAGSNVSVTSDGTSGEVFSSWGVSNAANLGLGSKTNVATNVTVRGTGTVTGKFVAGTPCTTCTITFYEVGLPVGATWDISYNSQLYFSTVTSTTTSLTLTGIAAGGYLYWGASSYVTSTGSSTHQEVYYTPTSSGYLYVPYELGYTLVYTPEYYLSVVQNPLYYTGTSYAPSSGWYPAGTNVALATSGSSYWSFSKWTSNSTSAVIAKSTSAATTVLLNGPATVTANFVQKYATVNITEVGLPHGTSWGITLGGVFYGSSTATILIHSVAYGSYSWSVATPLPGSAAGSEWIADSATYAAMSGSMSVPYQTMQNVVFQLVYSVDIVVSGTAGGSTVPAGQAWYFPGTVIAISADNGTTATFSAWSVSSPTTLTVAAPSQAATYLTITGAGTVTCTFT